MLVSGREVHPLIWAVDEDRVVGRNFLVGDRDQLYLLPVSISEWLPEDHLAWFVLDAVDEMDLDGFYAGSREDGWGGAAHHPKIMVALLSAHVLDRAALEPGSSVPVRWM